MRCTRGFFSSMTGQLFAVLVVGMAAAAVVATAVTHVYGSRDFDRQIDERVADLLEAYAEFLDAAPADVRARMLRDGGPGIRPQLDGAHGPVDEEFTSALASRGGLVAGASAEQASLDVCFPEIRSLPIAEMAEALRRMRGLLVASGSTFVPPKCRLVSITFGDGTKARFSLTAPSVQRLRSRLLDPAFLGLFGAGIALLAYLAARLATAPLRRMADAAADLGRNLDRAPLALMGSSEVRQAAAAFNAMQARLQGLFGERTRMLAAITHDLQTPLTRLRLRLERVEDEDLRERLVTDLQAIRALVDEGLELARSADAAEPLVLLDIDSLLESLVEDAVDSGADARFVSGCGAALHLQPLATRRMFANLIDNAIKHGGSARVTALTEQDAVVVLVRDCGLGVPESVLKSLLAPFTHTDASGSRHTGGGLGLTIAQSLAEKGGAKLTLRNHPDGGLEARVSWRRDLRSEALAAA